MAALRSLLIVCPAVCLVSALLGGPPPNYMEAKVGSLPALQPVEVFDEDFPNDGPKLTPMELRYKAQADYARALAMLKRERAEADAAEKAMKAALKTYQEAADAAKNAKVNAEQAAHDKAALSDAAVDLDTKAKVATASAENHRVVVDHEKKDLEAADAAYKAAMQGTKGTKDKIGKLTTKRQELDQKIKALEAESQAMGHTLTDSRQSAAAKKNQVASTKQSVQARETQIAREAAQRAAAAHEAKLEAEAAQKKLDAAKEAAGYTDKDAVELKAAIAKEQKEFDDAEAKYMREKADADEAQKQVERAKADLAKFEEKSYSGRPALVPSALVALLASTAASLF